MRKVQEAEEARKKQLKSTLSSPTKGVIAPRVASPKSALSESMMQLKSRFEQKPSSGSGLSSPVPPALSSPSVYSQRSVPRVPPPQTVRVPPPQSIQKPQVPQSIQQSIQKPQVPSSQPIPKPPQVPQSQSIQKPQPQSVPKAQSQPIQLPTPSTPNLPPVLASPHHTKLLTVAPQPTPATPTSQPEQPEQSEEAKEPQEQWFELPLLEEYIRRQRVSERAPCESVEHRPRPHLREDRDVRAGRWWWLWRLSGRHLPRQPSHQTVSARILRRVERRGDAEESGDDREGRRGVRVVCWRRSEWAHNRGCVDMFKRINRCYAKG